MNTIEKIKSYFTSLNAGEVLAVLTIFFLAIVPHSIATRQHWVNLFPLKYIYLFSFICTLFLLNKKVVDYIRRDFPIYLLIGTFFVLFYLFRGYIELSFIPLCMTIFCLRVLNTYEIRFEKIYPILLFTVVLLLIKFPIYTWANSRYNMGLGNPNHAGLTLAALLLPLAFNRKYAPVLFLLATIFIVRSYAAILAAIAILMLIPLYHFSFTQKLLKKIHFSLIPIGCVAFLLAFVGAFHSVAGDKMAAYEEAIKEISVDENGENITLMTPEVFFDKASRVKFNYTSKIFDLSGYTRVFQLDGFRRNFQDFILLGDEKSFVKKVFFTPHNNVLGMISIFGLITFLIYIYFLTGIFKSNAFLLAPFIPILGSDTAVSFYGFYFVLIFVCVRLCKERPLNEASL